MCRVALCEVGAAADEAVLYKLDDRGVVHRHVRNVMLPGERRDYKIGDAESKLGGKSFLGRSVIGIRAGVDRLQVAMNGRKSAGRKARIVAVCVHGDGADIRKRSGVAVGIVVRMVRNGRNVIEGTTRFVIAQEEY